MRRRADDLDLTNSTYSASDDTLRDLSVRVSLSLLETIEVPFGLPRPTTSSGGGRMGTCVLTYETPRKLMACSEAGPGILRTVDPGRRSPTPSHRHLSATCGGGCQAGSDPVVAHTSTPRVGS